MALTYPYGLSVLADQLPIESCVFDVQRNDQVDGDAEGRVWQAQLAPPLWTADVGIVPLYHHEAKRILALLRKLHGSQESFWLYDPSSQYPHADQTGSIYGASNAKVHSVGSGRQTIRIKDLPSAYELKAGDKGQIAYGSSPVRNFYFEVSEDVTASAGVTPEFEIFPHVPSAVAADDAITLIKPACKMFIMPGTLYPGEQRDVRTVGISFKAMERKP
jgi:hypothetical protein